MGFDIPEPFVLDESFKVFANLDEEHQNLFHAVFNLCPDNSAGNLQALVDVTAHYFGGGDEGMMQKAGYGGNDPHKKIHDEFLGKLRGLSAPIDDGTVNYAKDWLVNHIKGTDFRERTKCKKLKPEGAMDKKGI